jgi:DNA-binding beta-propeller fold protein YncE
VYVTCTDNDYIHVFDGNTLEQVAQLRDGFDGPYWMAFYDLGTGPRALVANFENSTVAVVAIDPVTMAHRTVAVVGAPRKKASGEY